MGRPSNTLGKLLARYVKKCPSGCWLWTGLVGERGYGVVTYRYKRWAAHRLFAHLHGANVENQLVCHHCDNPLCVNPSHLFVGSQSDNCLDMIRKGRGRRRRNGEYSGTAKLTPGEVKRMLTLRSRGMTQCKLSSLFGISQPHVCRILARKSWKHLGTTRRQ